MTRPTKMFSKIACKETTIRRAVYKELAEENQRRRDRLFYGSLGPASPVKRIDPKTGSVIEVIEK